MRDKVLAAIELYAAGGTIERACELADVSNTPFRRLLREDSDVMAKYETAIRARSYVYHDDAYSVAAQLGTDEGLNAQDARVKAEILMKLGGKINPDRFGDRVNVQHDIKPSITAAIQEGKQRALRPPCDPAHVIDAEYTVITDASQPETSDCLSDAPSIAPGDDEIDPFAP